MVIIIDLNSPFTLMLLDFHNASNCNSTTKLMKITVHKTFMSGYFTVFHYMELKLQKVGACQDN